MSELDADQVVEEYRQLIGADRVHVDYMPGVDPQALKKELAKVNDQFVEYDSYPETLRLKAEISQLEGRLTRLSKLAQVDFRTVFDEPKELRDLRHKIFTETDIISMNLSEALEFCRKRTK